MKNIKTIELTEPRFGLQAGTELTRMSESDDFVYNAEHVSDYYTHKQVVTVSPSMLDRSFAKAKEWFVDRKPAKQVISELEAELAAAKDDNVALGDRITKLDRELEWYKAVMERIATKRAEFELKLKELEAQLDDDLIAGETMEWADEAMTVYYNLIDLLKKLTA